MPLFLALLLALIGAEGINQKAKNDEGKPATSVKVSEPGSLAVFESFLYVADEPEGSIRRVDLKTRTISTLHLKGKLGHFDGIAADPAGNLIVCEFSLDRISKINVKDGTVACIAGDHGLGFSGDNGPATQAQLSCPCSPTFDGSGNIYFADMGNNRIRRIDSKGIITSIAGNGSQRTSGDGGLPTLAGLEYPNGVAIDIDGGILISQYGYGPESQRIRKIDALTAVINSIAGLGGRGLGGDGGPALSAQLQSPARVMLDLNRNILILDPVNDRIRRIDARTLVITTIAGTTKGFSGDGGLATAAKLNNPSHMAIDKQGNLYIADYVNNRVRRVDAVTGIITTVAGNGDGTKVHIIL